MGYIFKKIKKVTAWLNALLFVYLKPAISYKAEVFPETQRVGLCLVAIAFNNLKVIELQYNYLKQNLTDDYLYIVADNSDSREVSAAIYALCKRLDITYIKLPQNPYSSLNPSRSHGLALNWMYRNFISRLRPEHFGFLDHDVFPVFKTSVTKLLADYPIFGFLQERGSRWYLWPGFCFFNFDYFKAKTLNFLPARGLDTGGGNYKKIFKGLDKKRLQKIRHEYFKISDSMPDSEVQLSNVELIGDWLHLMNVSGWMKGPSKKIDTLENIHKIINNIQKKYEKYQLQ